MNCTDLLSQLTDYFDGVISPELLAEVKEHIGECDHCRVVVNTTRKTIEVYRGNEVFEFSDEMRERLHSSIMAKCRGARKQA